jgi:hypothetical protein
MEEGFGGSSEGSSTRSPSAPQGKARRLFKVMGGPRWLVASGMATVFLYLAMVPSFHGMSDHGASLGSFEDAGSVGRSSEIVDEWGDAGRDAARSQLLIDLPFMVSYASFLAGACMFVAGRARRLGRSRLTRLAAAIAWCGPIAAACDLAQNIALALILGGHHTQPWPRISAVTAIVTRGLAEGALLFVIVGAAITLFPRPQTEG